MGGVSKKHWVDHSGEGDLRQWQEFDAILDFTCIRLVEDFHCGRKRMRENVGIWIEIE